LFSGTSDRSHLYFACAAVQGPANTIKAEQVLFQAQKKASGNTHTARGMIPNMAAFVFIMGGGTIMMLTTLRKLYWGVGKIELKD
jgi:hypothetical protein